MRAMIALSVPGTVGSGSPLPTLGGRVPWRTRSAVPAGHPRPLSIARRVRDLGTRVPRSATSQVSGDTPPVIAACCCVRPWASRSFFIARARRAGSGFLSISLSYRTCIYRHNEETMNKAIYCKKTRPVFYFFYGVLSRRQPEAHTPGLRHSQAGESI